jgi:hypothetical protein
MNDYGRSEQNIAIDDRATPKEWWQASREERTDQISPLPDCPTGIFQMSAHLDNIQ